MSNFPAWWALCQQPDNDGHADDTSGGDVTRWGWTWSTYMDARHHLGKVPIYDEFLALTQPQAMMLAQVYSWPKGGGLLLNSGPDVVVVDWEWTSGGAVTEIQFQLGFQDADLDGIMGPHTAHAINAIDPATFIAECSQWRSDYYDQLGFRDIYPGLYRRTDEAKALGLSLLKQKIGS